MHVSLCCCQTSSKLQLFILPVVALQDPSSGRKTKAAKQQRPATPRILVAAHTNVAVDRVLLGLLDSGFDSSQVLRIGSLQRIAKRLLGVSLHSAGTRFRFV